MHGYSFVHEASITRICGSATTIFKYFQMPGEIVCRYQTRRLVCSDWRAHRREAKHGGGLFQAACGFRRCGMLVLNGQECAGEGSPYAGSGPKRRLLVRPDNRPSSALRPRPQTSARSSAGRYVHRRECLHRRPDLVDLYFPDADKKERSARMGASAQCSQRNRELALYYRGRKDKVGEALPKCSTLKDYYRFFRSRKSSGHAAVDVEAASG